MKESSAKIGRPVTQHVFVFDLEGFSLKAATHKPTLDILLQLVHLYEGKLKNNLFEIP